MIDVMATAKEQNEKCKKHDSRLCTTPKRKNILPKRGKHCPSEQKGMNSEMGQETGVGRRWEYRRFSSR